jgi:hypothetical protein
VVVAGPTVIGGAVAAVAAMGGLMVIPDAKAAASTLGAAAAVSKW